MGEVDLEEIWREAFAGKWAAMDEPAPMDVPKCAHTSRYTVPAAVFCHGPTWYAESSAGRNSTFTGRRAPVPSRVA